MIHNRTQKYGLSIHLFFPIKSFLFVKRHTQKFISKQNRSYHDIHFKRWINKQLHTKIRFELKKNWAIITTIQKIKNQRIENNYQNCLFSRDIFMRVLSLWVFDKMKTQMEHIHGHLWHICSIKVNLSWQSPFVRSCVVRCFRIKLEICVVYECSL